MFHDESERVIEKVHAQKGTRRPAESAPEVSLSPSTTASTTIASPSDRASDLAAEELPSATLLTRSSTRDSAVELSCHGGGSNPSFSPRASPANSLPGLDDLALAYFFDTYVYKYNDKRDQWDIEVGNGCLLAAVKALGTAGAVSQIGRSHQLEAEAQKQYVDAIRKTNNALQNSIERTRDSTLVAITILGIFENVSGFQRNLDSWREHVNGAASLLQLRGSKQFSTQTGCRLFLQTCTNLILSCLSRRLPIPAHVRAMQKVAERFIPDPTESVWRFHLAGLRIADLNARLLPGNYPASPPQAQSIVDDALALYAELESILADAPEDWKPRYRGATGQMIYSDYCYVFDSYIIAQIFSGNWGYRIMLTDVLRKALVNLRASGNKVDRAQLDRIQFYIGSVRQLQLNILAVIPQHLSHRFPIHYTTDASGHITEQPSSGFNSRNHNPFRHAEENEVALPFVRMSGGYQTQFPLFAAGAADPPGGPVRMWVVGALKTLHQSMGVQQVSP